MYHVSMIWYLTLRNSLKLFRFETGFMLISLKKKQTYLSEMHTEIFITEILKWCLGFANKNVVPKAKNGCGYRWKKTGLTWKTHNGESVHLTKVKWAREQLYHRFKIKDMKGYPFPTFPLCSHNINNKSHYFHWH